MRDATELTDTCLPTSTQALAFVDDYLPALLARASQQLSEPFHRAVQAAGLSTAEWRILASLTDSTGLSTGALAELALCKQPTVTRLLDRMQARGYVERFAHASDRRITLVRAMPAGQAMATALIEQARTLERQLLEPIGLQQYETLKLNLRRLLAQQAPCD